jgi:ATP-dependent RNA helicase DDX49/DBP8
MHQDASKIFVAEALQRHKVEDLYTESKSKQQTDPAATINGIMAKGLKGRVSVGKATKLKDAAMAPASATMVTLDQDEVMRAMMASIKGKARDMSQSGSDDEGEDEEEDEDEQDDEEGSDEEEESDENGVGSSSSGFSKRSRSPSPVLKRKPTDDKEDPKRSLPAQSLGTSRVKLSSIKQTPDVVKSPFDHPKAAPISSFASLGLSQPLINALAGISILKPTEIQSACVGPIMEGVLCD